MTRTWSLAEQIYRSFHGWPIMLAFCLAGGLIGWLAASLWPATYRATADIDVALNPYRYYEDTNFQALLRPKYSNLDDYKSWQMSQLMAAIYRDEIIEETLRRLQSQDTAWQAVGSQELRSMLDTNWRTAGKWSLVAEHEHPELVEQAALTWREVVLDRMVPAIAASRQAIFTDEAVQALIQKQVDGEERLSRLQAAQAAIEQWQAELAGLPPDQPLDTTQRWPILALVTGLAEFSPDWTALLAAQPAEADSPGAYAAWLAQVSVALQSESSILRESLQELLSEQDRLKAQFDEQSKQSMALSPSIEIAALDQVSRATIRPQSLLALVGGILGFLIWLLLELVKIARWEKQVE